MSEVINNVPELRFTGFTDEWPEKKLDSVLTIGSGKDYKHLDNGDIPVFGTGGYMLSVNDYLYDGVSVCIGRKGTIDKPRLLKGKFWTVDTLFYTHAYKKSIPEFIFGVFQKINWKKYNEASGVPSLSKSTIEKIKVGIPSVDEQQKIADFLSSVDKKIEQLTEKHRLLTEYKKGVMQQIFTQQIRFKDNNGNDYPEWVGCLLGDHFEVGSSKRVLQEDWVSSGIPFLRTRELVSLSKKQPFSSEIFISPILFKELSDNYGTPVEGDFLVSGVGTLGIHYQVKASDKFYFKDGNVLWLKRKPTINADFFNFSFQSNFVQSQIVAQASTTTVGTYTIQNAKKTKLLIPKSLEEQQKIANFLTEIDQKIDQAWSILEETKAFKKGLLQKMFV